MRLLSLLAAAAIVLGLFALGGQPYAAGLVPTPWDKLAHVVVYAALAILVWTGCGGPAFLEGRAHRAGALAVSVLAVGLLDELHQAAIPGRSADLSDLVADALGICLAFYFLRSRKTALKGTP